MAGRFETFFTTIASGSTVSGIVALAGADLFSLWVPVLSSGSNVFLQGSYDQTSANFLRLTNPAGSGDWILGPGGASPGSRAVTLQDPGFGWPFLRIETSVAQTDTRTFCVLVKLR